MPIGASTDSLRAVALQPDGRLVAAGYTYTEMRQDAALVRFLPGGVVDPSFGQGGLVRVASDPDYTHSDFWSVAILPGPGPRLETTCSSRDSAPMARERFLGL